MAVGGGTSSCIVILKINILYVGPSYTVQRTSKPLISPLIFSSKLPQLISFRFHPACHAPLRRMELPTMAHFQLPVRRPCRWLHSSPWKNNVHRLDLADVSCTTFKTMKAAQLARQQQSELVGLQQSELVRRGNLNSSDDSNLNSSDGSNLNSSDGVIQNCRTIQFELVKRGNENSSDDAI